MINTLRYNRPRAIRPAELLAALPDGKRLLARRGRQRPAHAAPPLKRGRSRCASRTLFCELSHELPLVFPVHPCARVRIEAGRAGTQPGARSPSQTPVGYLDMLGLMGGARQVLSDSGGIQEESAALGVPCITLRENTERPITVSEGTNTVAGTDSDRTRIAFREALADRGKAGRGHRAPGRPLGGAHRRRDRRLDRR